ncbi:MAG TPA: DUF1592 domain-containing protein [Candidatus Saccharimonadales bacterium]|nr:DUF1592 domain-containing protein [Candidatus Saccharimonadales bacterium]
MCLLTCVGMILSCSGLQAAEIQTAYEKEIRPILDTYCFKCHGQSKAKGGVNLYAYKDLTAVNHDPKTWNTVMTQMRDRNMPPENKPQPTQGERDKLMAWLEQVFDKMDESQIAKDPGRVVIHRLSRLEYNNTIRDLLGVDTQPADKFPADGGGGGGFDNNADTLFVPPILMERYFDAAEQILAAAAPEAVFVAKPGFMVSKSSAARKILEHHATRAFRRPVLRAEVDRLMKLYEETLRSGKSHESAVKLAMKAILVSPSFLFRVEEDRGTTEPYPLNDYELASRLSYFIWSSMPDDQLFRLAGQHQLHEPSVLEAQVRRMLDDPKGRVLAQNFASQWLRVRDLKTTVQPDQNRFKTYTRELRDAMYEEPVEFFYSLLKENESLLKLLDSDYTYVNEPLARHYGIEGVEGTEMRRVALKDRNRGGVVGMAGVLTLTSYPLRTSPVLRGKYVLEELLGTPPPPPPPLVKSLPPDDKPRDGLTLRQRLEKHRENPDCAACHKRMDPLGFGLENFDAIGRWRTETAGKPVDASGEMTTGEKFTGPAELKKVLLSRKEDFVRNMSEKMLAYALGRGLEFTDTPAVRKIAKAVAADNCRSSTLILEVTKSYPFQYRRDNPAQVAEK